MHAHPRAQIAQLLGHVIKLGAHFAAMEFAGGIFRVHAIGGGVLADHQQFLHAGFHQALGLVKHRSHGPRNQIAANGWE